MTKNYEVTVTFDHQTPIRSSTSPSGCLCHMKNFPQGVPETLGSKA